LAINVLARQTLIAPDGVLMFVMPVDRTGSQISHTHTHTHTPHINSNTFIHSPLTFIGMNEIMARGFSTYKFDQQSLPGQLKTRAIPDSKVCIEIINLVLIVSRVVYLSISSTNADKIVGSSKFCVS
jgi:hypothetical protein